MFKSYKFAVLSIALLVSAKSFSAATSTAVATPSASASTTSAPININVECPTILGTLGGWVTSAKNGVVSAAKSTSTFVNNNKNVIGAGVAGAALAAIAIYVYQTYNTESSNN